MPPSAPAESPRPRLADRLPSAALRDADPILDGFLGWLADAGTVAYPEQEEAFLELMADRHLVLSTPTGSGKSLVALALHWKALCEGRRSFYTAPIKALVSEKFFAWCDEFGAERVGMLTGDASINADAPVVCCTTEVLANMALRQGAATDAPYVVLDEFHYYGDRERGASWQIPLITLRDTLFLMMSATLGNTAPIEERLRDFTGREVTHVHSDGRPVPLEFDYRETPLHETLETLVERDRAPVYVVHFTQRECGEQAQGLTSARLCSPETRKRIAAELRDVRFDTPYGRDLQRFLRAGIGVHHAGLLPKYRLLVERLAQQRLLRVICGTDTLGVGVNIPIRTVCFSRLCKFDGEKVSILSVRDFKQIAGRAGRKGFDERGYVVCQAPEHVIEKKRLAAKEGGKRKLAKKKPPSQGFVPWNRDTFFSLVERPPEMLSSQFEVSHGMVVSVLQREATNAARGGSYRALLDLIGRSHDSEGARARSRRRAAALFRSLRSAGIVRTVWNTERGEREVRIDPELQLDFSLHRTLSLYVVEAVDALDPEALSYPLEVLSLVEAILEDPRPLLAAQTRKRRGELLARLKAEGVDYEDRLRQLEEVSHDKPEADFILASFREFERTHPWAEGAVISPKGVARELVETGLGFVDFVREYSVARSEGLLLRYLSDAHNTLVKTVPLAARSEGVLDVIATLHAVIQRIDTSLVDAWESLLAPAQSEAAAAAAGEARSFDLAVQEKLLAARARAELHELLRALARGDYAEAVDCVRHGPDDAWDAARFERELAPFLEEHGAIDFTPRARQPRHTLIRRREPRVFDVFQTLLDPQGEGLWAVEGEIDLRQERDPEGPLVRVRRIGS